MTSHWDVYYRHWSLLGAPLRPPAEAVEAVEREGRLHGADVLLLGVTPELARLGRTLLAVDASSAMIAALWAGDTDVRRAVLGSWHDLPLGHAEVDAVIGDGSLNSLGTAAQRTELLREAARVLRPGGRTAIRIFAAPERREGLAEIAAEAAAGRVGSFHAFKLRVAMALAGKEPDCSVPVMDIRQAIDGLFPDRQAFSAMTGWTREEVATVDAYEHSDAVYSFATARRLGEEAAEVFREVRLAPSGAYHLADRCPILVVSRAR